MKYGTEIDGFMFIIYAPGLKTACELYESPAPWISSLLIFAPIKIEKIFLRKNVGDPSFA